MAIELNITQYYELMLYLSGGYDFNTSEEVIIRLSDEVGFNSVGDIIDYKRTFPNVSTGNLTIFNYVNTGGGRLILDLNGFTIEGIYTNKATQLIDCSSIRNCIIRNGGFAIDIQSNGTFMFSPSSSNASTFITMSRLNIAINFNNTSISDIIYYNNIVECQLLLTGSIRSNLPNLRSGYIDGFLIFCDNLTVFNTVLFTNNNINRVGVVGTIIVIGNSLTYSTSNSSNVNRFVDLTIVSDTITSFTFGNGLSTDNSIYIFRFVKSNLVDLNNILSSVSIVNNGRSNFNNFVCGNSSIFNDSFNIDRKSRIFINNYLSPDLYNSNYILNVLGFQTYENI